MVVQWFLKIRLESFVKTVLSSVLRNAKNASVWMKCLTTHLFLPQIFLPSWSSLMLNSKLRDFPSKLWCGARRNCKWRDETTLTNTLEIRACILLWYCDVKPWCASVSLSPRYFPCLPENALSTVKFCSWPFSHLHANDSHLTSISLLARQSKNKQGLLVLKILKILKGEYAHTVVIKR